MSTSKVSRALLALLLLLFVTPLRAKHNHDDEENRFELNYSRTLHYGGGRVSIDHRFGDLEVRTQSGSSVVVRATIRCSDPDLGKQIRINAVEEGGGVSVKTIFPEVHVHRGNISYSVDMTVTIPPNATLLAKNQFGSTDVRGLNASSTIDNRQGAIEFGDSRGGSHTITNAFGAIKVENVAGDLTINNSNGQIDVQKAGGRLTITNRFGSIAVDDAKRDVTISNANGQITTLDVGGSLKVTNQFGNVKASTISGGADITTTNARVDLSNVGSSATVRNSFGSVTAQAIRGDLTVDGQNSKVDAANVSGNAKVDTAFGGVTLQNIGGLVDVTTSNGNINVTDIGAFTAETRFGSVRAERVRGSADVKGSNGGITLQEISGDVKVRTTFGGAFINGVNGSVDVQNQNGAISVEGLRGGGCKPVSLRTTFSSIKVALPASSGYSVNARTSFGRISSEIPITTTNVGDNTLIGTIGRGGCRLDLSNSNGSITIARE